MDSKQSIEYLCAICVRLRKEFRVLLSISVISLIIALCSDFALGQTLNQTPEDMSASLNAAIEPLMENSGGEFTPEARTAYLNWATKIVMGQLAQQGETPPEDCLAEVRADDNLYDAMFGAVFPPDPSILQNYARLRTELGAQFMARYRSLVTAVAVARRINGVETSQDMDAIGVYGSGKRENGDRDAEGNYQPGFWVDESLHSVKTKKEKAFIAHIADFMSANHVSALELYQNANLRAQLITLLETHKVSSSLIAEVQQPVRFGERLKNAMVRLGQRPAAREEKPDAASWLRYLASIYEASPSSIPVVDGKLMSWPLFPIDKAPWPLLMPFARPVPLGEAKYIWETYQGQHGLDRYHTYGPFRDDKDAMPYELQPSLWFWDAWPDRILHGGECVPISKGTVDLYSCLDKPAVWAGQPGHANLISFESGNEGWTATIEQAFAGGPDATFAQWYFDDIPGTELRFRDLYNWAGAEYHLGLALGMNRGLRSYMDTRMVANIFNVLTPQEKQAMGEKLLKRALESNPFNPDIWYRLAQLMPDAENGMGLVQAVLRQPPDGIGYWQTVEEFVAQYAIFDQPLPQSEAELRRICTFLQSVPGVQSGDLKSYAAKFYRHLADNGDAYGQLRIAERYQDGVGVAKDENSAREYFARSAAQGNEDATRELELLNDTVPADEITLTASSQYSSDQSVTNLVDGSGMWRGLHDNNGSAQTMWHSVENPAPQPPAHGLAPSPAWVRFDFLAPEKLNSILIWNHNQANLTDRGFRNTRIYGSSDGITWFSMTSPQTIELPRANGNPGLAAVIIMNAARQSLVKSVIVAAGAVDGNYGSDCFGLSAVHFIAVPKITEGQLPGTQL